MQAKSFSKMSAIELADIQIPGEPLCTLRPREFLIDRQTETSIADTTLWAGSRNLDQLADFITKSECHRFRSPFTYLTRRPLQWRRRFVPVWHSAPKPMEPQRLSL